MTTINVAAGSVNAAVTTTVRNPFSLIDAQPADVYCAAYKGVANSLAWNIVNKLIIQARMDRKDRRLAAEAAAIADVNEHGLDERNEQDEGDRYDGLIGATITEFQTVEHGFIVKEKPITEASRLYAFYSTVRRKIASVGRNEWDEPQSLEDALQSMIDKPSLPNQEFIAAAAEMYEIPVEDMRKILEQDAKWDSEKLNDLREEVVSLINSMEDEEDVELTPEFAFEQLPIMQRLSVFNAVHRALDRESQRLLDVARRRRSKDLLTTGTIVVRAQKAVKSMLEAFERNNRVAIENARNARAAFRKQ